MAKNKVDNNAAKIKGKEVLTKNGEKIVFEPDSDQYAVFKVECDKNPKTGKVSFRSKTAVLGHDGTQKVCSISEAEANLMNHGIGRDSIGTFNQTLRTGLLYEVVKAPKPANTSQSLDD